MNYLLIILTIAIFATLFFALAIWRHKITPTELILSIATTCLMTTGVYYATAYSNMADTQIINGHVTDKKKNRVSCRHSYECNCYYSGTGKNRTRHCSTCYEHSHDFDWDVYTTIGEIGISTIDRQGLREPPRWSLVRVGEPVAREESYTNYIKGSPSSIFNKSQLSLVPRYASKIPKYPEVFDYYRVNRVFSMGVPIKDLELWNFGVSEMLKKLNPGKQVNFTLIFTKESSLDYVEAVNAKWLGGKKNDVTLIISSPDGVKMNWVRVLAWSRSSAIKTYLRDDLMAIGEINIDKFIPVIQSNIQSHYQRKSMKDFKYLLDAMEIGDVAFAFIVLFAISISAGLSWVFARPEHDFSFFEWIKSMFAKPKTPTYRFSSRRF